VEPTRGHERETSGHLEIVARSAPGDAEAAATDHHGGWRRRWRGLCHPRRRLRNSEFGMPLDVPL